MDNKKKIVDGIFKKLKEMSSVGSGGVSFTTGTGPQYAYKLGYKLAPNQPLDEANPGATLSRGPKAGPKGVANNILVKKFGYKPVKS
jgi:hypothetical protein